jgi:hypothetical protein
MLLCMHRLNMWRRVDRQAEGLGAPQPLKHMPMDHPALTGTYNQCCHFPAGRQPSWHPADALQPCLPPHPRLPTQPLPLQACPARCGPLVIKARGLLLRPAALWHSADAFDHPPPSTPPPLATQPLPLQACPVPCGPRLSANRSAWQVALMLSSVPVLQAGLRSWWVSCASHGSIVYCGWPTL